MYDPIGLLHTTLSPKKLVELELTGLVRFLPLTVKVIQEMLFYEKQCSVFFFFPAGKLKFMVKAMKKILIFDQLTMGYFKFCCFQVHNGLSPEVGSGKLEHHPGSISALCAASR